MKEALLEEYKPKFESTEDKIINEEINKLLHDEDYLNGLIKNPWTGGYNAMERLVNSVLLEIGKRSDVCEKYSEKEIQEVYSRKLIKELIENFAKNNKELLEINNTSGKYIVRIPKRMVGISDENEDELLKNNSGISLWN